jgi:hypothetical protein
VTPFAKELSKAIKARGLRKVDVWRPARISRSTLMNALSGNDTPSIETAERLADVLGWPSLVDVARRSREGRCAICGAPFLAATHATKRRYCGSNCTQIAHMRLARESQRKRTLTDTRLVKQRLAIYQESVAAFCRQCGDTECPDATCLLRELSPLPLARQAGRAA